MNKIIIYFSILILSVLGIYIIKKISINEQPIIKNKAPFNENIIAEVEILNGCGETGIAKLYTNFLRANNYDVIDSKNADHFNYINTEILIHNKDKQNIAKLLAYKLNIKDKNVHYKSNKYNLWDLTLIIGKDYKELDSFNIVNKFYEPF